ncbi:HK97 gp10 family phage protein [Aromatoleum toluolicum]|nr:HK97 gp10 family phage protein [Aromatoleum toluolicum]NMF98389.2 HK97 gp10 family phage protein [Aromatoleum toluolicum]
MTKPSRTSAGRARSYAARKPSLTIMMPTDAIDRMIDALATDVEEAVRPAAQAAAQVLYEAVHRNVAAIGKVSGNLARSIYQAYSKDNSGEGRATYHISWNAAKAPHGHLVEYGHLQKFATYLGKDGKWHTDKNHPLPVPRQVAARPFVRPAQAHFPQAEAAAIDELLRRIGVL